MWGWGEVGVLYQRKGRCWGSAVIMAVNHALATVSFITPENLLGNSPIFSSMCLVQNWGRGSKPCFRAQEVVSVAFM